MANTNMYTLTEQIKDKILEIYGARNEDGTLKAGSWVTKAEKALSMIKVVDNEGVVELEEIFDFDDFPFILIKFGESKLVAHDSPDGAGSKKWFQEVAEIYIAALMSDATEELVDSRKHQITSLLREHFKHNLESLHATQKSDFLAPWGISGASLVITNELAGFRLSVGLKEDL